jgi:hypothetical protein
MKRSEANRERVIPIQTKNLSFFDIGGIISFHLKNGLSHFQMA